MSGYGGKRCGNCGHDMEYVNTEKIQLGQYSGLFGHWSNLLAGALDVEIWSCPNCRKLDFYWNGPAEEDCAYWDGPAEEDCAYWDGPAEEDCVCRDGGDHIAQTTCPACGHVHDLDDPKCPLCGAKNPNI